MREGTVGKVGAVGFGFQGAKVDGEGMVGNGVGNWETSENWPNNRLVDGIGVVKPGNPDCCCVVPICPVIFPMSDCCAEVSRRIGVATSTS